MIFEKGGKLYRRYDKELLCLEPYGKNGLRVRATQLSEFSDERLSALIEPEEKAENAKVWVDGKTGYIENGKILCKVLRTGKMKFYDRHGKLLLEDYEKNRFRENDPEEKDSALEIAPRTFTPHLGTNSYKLSVKFEAKEDEKFYGMGEYAHPYLNLKGCALELSQRNSQISVPFTLSSRGYGFLWNNPAVGNVTLGENVTEWTAERTRQIDYWITAADTPAQILENYTAVTGRVPMMRRDLMGFWQCKLRYQTQDEVLRVVREHKKRGLPMDVIVIDFFHWTAQGDWQFDPRDFPDPKAMVDELKELGVNLMVSIWPTVDQRTDNYKKMSECGYLMHMDRGMPIHGTWMGPCTYYDAINPGARKFVWDCAKKNYYDLGIKLFWLDEAEPEDEEYTELRDALQKAQDGYDNINGQLQGYQAQLDAGKQQMYQQGLISSPTLDNDRLITEAKAALRKMKLQLLQGQLQLTTGTATAYTQFDAARQQLDAGWQEYNDGVQQLADSRAEYQSQKADAEEKLAQGLAQLNDAEEQVSQIKSGEWYVLDRGSTLSFVTFEQYADRMDAIARVFPVFFFLVAALVATTTMTRMVDENRLQMGTLKALGYTKAAIAGKYLFYALSATVLGSIVGMVIGFVVFPFIIWNAYQLIFDLPTFTLRFYPGMAAASVALSAAVIGLATWSACRSSLKERTAALLLPRAPVAGKRIFLEYITPLWKHMSFSQKTTARNLFRYKKRFFMTVLGVAGCTALLLIGFGLQDSLLPIVDKQTSQLTHNDMTVSFRDEKALTNEGGLADALKQAGTVDSWGVFYVKSTTLYNEAGDSAEISVVGAQKDADMTSCFTFRTRKDHEEIPFDDSSVILTEKTALNLGVKVGDTLYVESTDGRRVPVTLTGITENYMFTRLYLSNAQLKSYLDSEPVWNTVYGLTHCKNDTEYNALRARLLECSYVSGVSFTEDTNSMFDNLIVSLNSVVVLIIVCAAALAAVVLYNLISVNLAERKKELATIKVLGFYDKEVYRYIFREIELLALIGSGVGLLLGIPLHRFIILTVEMDQLMFIRTIAPHSYLLSVALTMLFTVVVCLGMRRHVKHISMVESMKAPE